VIEVDEVEGCERKCYCEDCSGEEYVFCGVHSFSLVVFGVLLFGDFSEGARVSVVLGAVSLFDFKVNYYSGSHFYAEDYY